MEHITVRAERGSAILGRLTKFSKGWRFYPWTESRRPSTHYWPTAEEAIPRWLKSASSGWTNQSHPDAARSPS